MVTRRNVRYSPLATDEDNFIETSLDRPFDPRFDFTPKALDKVPWKSIALAVFLLFLGTTLLVISLFVFTGHMGGERSQAYGLLVLGILSFLPGFTRLEPHIMHGGVPKDTVFLPFLLIRAVHNNTNSFLSVCDNSLIFGLRRIAM